MSEELKALGIRAAPMSKHDIEAVSIGILNRLSPASLAKPTAIDFARLIDHTLSETEGIDVYPASFEETLGREGLTQVLNARSTILLREDVEDAVRNPVDPYVRRARATFAHELGHASLHKQLLAALGCLPTLFRESRERIKVFEDPEWQAWTFAGFFLAPRSAVLASGVQSAVDLADAFGISVDMARVHMRRLDMP
jgi:Zn-dependent peptidase ImmA (M78 family)